MLGRCRVSVLLPECAGRAGAVPSSFKAKIRGNFPFGRDAARLWRGCLTLGCSQGGNNPPPGSAGTLCTAWSRVGRCSRSNLLLLDRDHLVPPAPSPSPAHTRMRWAQHTLRRDKSCPLLLHPSPRIIAPKSHPAASSCPPSHAPRPWEQVPSSGGATKPPSRCKQPGRAAQPRRPGGCFQGNCEGGQGEVWAVLVFL